MNDEILNPEETGVGRRIKDFYIQKITNVVDRDDTTAKSDEEIAHFDLESIALVSAPMLQVGEQGIFSVEVIPSICGVPKIQWESSDYSVISINSDGYFLAKKVGTATIRAYVVDSEISASLNLEVKAGLPIKTTLEISPASLELELGATGEISISTNSTGEISYVSSNPEVCSPSATESGADIDAVAAGNATITVTVAEVPGQYTSASGTVSVVVSGPATFGGLELSSGPLKYSNSSYEISSNWSETSLNEACGESEGSTFFTWDQCHEVDLDGWRLPTADELRDIVFGFGGRDGATVNGTEGRHFATLGDQTHQYGLLLFPDGKTITGATIDGFDDINTPTSLTQDEISVYLEQGCVFLPANKGYFSDEWTESGNGQGYYLTVSDGEEYPTNVLVFNFMIPDDYIFPEWTKTDEFFMVRLVKPTTPPSQ